MTEAAMWASIRGDFREMMAGDAPEDQVEMLLDFIQAYSQTSLFLRFLVDRGTVNGRPASIAPKPKR